MDNVGSIGEQFIKELREQLSKESQKMKWQRQIEVQTNYAWYTNPSYIAERYTKELAKQLVNDDE